MTINVTIRNLDENAYRKAKSEAAQEGKKIGTVISEAIDFWLSHKKEKKGRAFLNLIEKPHDWGVKTNAKDIDAWVYR